MTNPLFNRKPSTVRAVSVTPHPALSDLPLMMVRTALQRKQQLKNRMTIIVGIICNNGIVIASDSQNTDGFIKKSNAKKISILEFQNGNALVAESGSSELSGRAVEILTQAAKTTPLTDYRTGADLMEDAVKQIRAVMISNYSHGNWSMEEFQRYIETNWKFSLMLAYYHNDKPYVFTIDNVRQMATTVRDHYAPLGCGAELAHYLLAEQWEPGMDYHSGTVTAAYVVKHTIAHVNFCGDPVQLGVVLPKNDVHTYLTSRLYDRNICFHSFIYPAKDVQLIVDELMDAEQKRKSNRRSEIYEMLCNITDRERKRREQEKVNPSPSAA